MRALAITILLLFSSFASAETDLDKGWAWVLSQPKIRIYVPRSPGLGHQSAAIRIVQKLLNKNYQGEIELSTGYTITNEKIKILLPQLHAHKIKISHEHSLSDTVTLGFSGADDSSEDADLLNTYATNSEVYIRLQPPLWPKKNQVLVGKEVTTLQGLMTYEICPECFDSVDFLTAINSISNPSLKRSIVAFESARKDFTVVPLYIHPTYGFTTQFLDFLKIVKTEYKKTKNPKPLVFTFFNENMNFDSTQFREHLQMKFITREDFLGRNLPKQLKSIKSGDSAFIHVGALPAEQFNYQMLQATYLMGTSGVNTMTQALRHGIPFFRISHSFDFTRLASITEQLTPVAKQGYTTTVNGIEAFHLGDSELYANRRAQYIAECFQRNSPVRQFFKEAKTLMAGKDKLDVAVEKLYQIHLQTCEEKLLRAQPATLNR